MIHSAAIAHLVYKSSSENTHMSVSGTRFGSRTAFARMAPKVASNSRMSVVGIEHQPQR